MQAPLLTDFVTDTLITVVIQSFLYVSLILLTLLIRELSGNVVETVHVTVVDRGYAINIFQFD